MKQKFKNILKLFALGIVFVLASCEAEKEIAGHSGKREYTAKNISLAQFMSQTGISNFETTINIAPNTGNMQGKTADGKYELTDFEIDTDIIKSMEYTQKTTYSFKVHPKDTITTNYFNMIYYKKNNVWEKSIVELKPTAENLYKLQNGLTENFEGQMKQIYISEPIIYNVLCVTYSILEVNCTGCDPDEPCDGCNECIGMVTYEDCNITTGGTGSDGGFFDSTDTGNSPDGDDIVIDLNIDPLGSGTLGQTDKTPCEALKKTINSNLNSYLTPKLSDLKALASNNMNHEVGYEFKKDQTGNYSTGSLNSGNTDTGNSVVQQAGGTNYGQAHTHTVALYPIPSWQDVYSTMILYNGTFEANKQETVMFVIGKECSSCTDVHVYALKVTNIADFRRKMYFDMNNPNTVGFTEDQKIRNANETFAEKHTSTMNQAGLESLFLNNFASSGIQLYKANDSMDNWSSITLNPNPLYPPIKTPCN